MEDEARPDPKPAEPPALPGTDDATPAVPVAAEPDSPPAERPVESPELERRLRKLAGKHAPFRGPIVASTRGWVSSESRWHMFAARFLDFAVLTEEHLVLCSTGFFTRRPRRQVLREPLTRLVVTPIGEKPVRSLRVVGDFSRKIRLELHDDEHTATFVKELLQRTPADPRRRAEPWASIGQLGVQPALDPPDASPAIPPPADAPVDADPPEADAAGEPTARP